MASRFEIVDEDHIKEVKDKNEKENMKKTTEYWRNVFKKWENERNFQANLRPVYTGDFCSDLIKAAIFAAIFVVIPNRPCKLAAIS